jgi:hypothetical protein
VVFFSFLNYIVFNGINYNEGTFPSVQSLLGRDYVHFLGPSELWNPEKSSSRSLMTAEILHFYGIFIYTLVDSDVLISV